MPRAAQSYRIGGEACSPEALQAEARAAFLYVAAELYPLLDELLSIPEAPWFVGVPSRAIRAWLQGWADPPAGWDGLMEAVQAWARRWRLLDRGRPPEWLVEVALFTLASCRRCGQRFWDLPDWGRVVCTRSDNLVLPPVPMGREAIRPLPAGLRGILTLVLRDGVTQLACYYYPDLYGSGRFKRAIRENAKTVYRIWGVPPEEACRRIDSLVSEALAAGAVPGQWRSERRIVYWAARAIVGREAYEDIARTPNRAVSELPEFVSPPTVRNQVSEFLALIGLRRRSGRKDR
jgi:hypothetical protein